MTIRGFLGQLQGESIPCIAILGHQSVTGYTVKGTTVVHTASVDLPVELQDISADALSQRLDELKEALGIPKLTVKEVAFVLKADLCNFILLETPVLTDENLQEYVRSVLKQNPAIDIDRSYYPFQVISQLHGSKQYALVSVIAKKIIEKIAVAARNARCIPLVVTPAPLATFHYLQRTYPLEVSKTYLVIEVSKGIIYSILIRNYAVSTIVARRVDGVTEALRDEVKKFMIFSESRGEAFDEILLIADDKIEGLADIFQGFHIVNMEDYYGFAPTLLPIFGVAQDIRAYPDIENVNLLPVPSTREFSLLRIYYLTRFWIAVQIALFLLSFGVLGSYWYFLRTLQTQIASAGANGTRAFSANERAELQNLQAKATEFNNFVTNYSALLGASASPTLDAARKVLDATPPDVTLTRIAVNGNTLAVTATTRNKPKITQYRDTIAQATGAHVDLPIAKVQDLGTYAQFELDITL